MHLRFPTVCTILQWFWGGLVLVSLGRFDFFTGALVALLVSFALMTFKLPQLLLRCCERFVHNVGLSIVVAIIAPLLMYLAVWCFVALLIPLESRNCLVWMEAAPYPCSFYEFYGQCVFFGAFALWPILLLEMGNLASVFRSSRLAARDQVAQ